MTRSPRRARTRAPDRIVAFSADLEKSRRVADRRGAGVLIERVLRELAAEFRSEWAAPPMTTRGIDEISAAMRRPDRAFDVIVALNTAFWPLRFRCAIADGTIDVGAGSRNASSMDGPAFHRASGALARARRDGLHFTVHLEQMGEADAALLEAACAGHAELMRRWTPRGREVSLAYRESETQTLTARALRTTQQNVQEHLERSAEATMRRIEDAVRLRLSSVSGA